MKIFSRFSFIILPTILFFSNQPCSSQVYTQQWIATFGNDSVPAVYSPAQLCMDPSGFIYSISNRDSASYWQTIELSKYNAAGSCLWRQIYANPDTENVEATCIVSDNAGNLYVGGHEWVQNQKNDYLVLKYDSSGNLLWTFHFNGPFNEDDNVNAISVDGNGNCYVSGSAGLSGDPYFYTDALTCKIDPMGNLIWERYYNYPLDTLSFDETQSLFLNADNDLILAGQFNDASAVCKYDSAGNLIWTSVPLPYSTFDVSLDDSSNIYAAGDESGNDATTIKLDSSGIIQWTNTVPFGTSTSLQTILYAGGSVYVTGGKKPGGLNTRYDVLVMKYNVTGDTLWTRTYNAPADENDFGSKILSSNNSIIVVGSSGMPSSDYNLLALNYDASGNLQWTYENTDSIYVQYFVDALLDQTGSLVIASTTRLYANSFELVSLSGSGIFQWNDFREDYQTGNDFASKVIFDSGGNLVVGGISNSITWSQDVLIIKYNPAGMLLWKTRITQQNRTSQTLPQLITNPYDEIFFCGAADTFLGGDKEKLLVGKLNASGAIQWVKQFSDSLSTRTLASSIAWHPDGSLYVLGYSLRTNGLGKETYLLKLDSFGNILWKKTIADSSLADNGECLVFDSSWNLYAAYRGVFNGQTIQAVCKLDTTGTIAWTQWYTGPGFGAETPKKILVDHAGDIVLAGFSDSLSWDMVVIKYDMNGNYQWHYRYDGPGSNWDIPNDMAIDEFNNIYVTGESEDINSYGDCYTFKLDASGNLKWESRYAGTFTVPVDVGSAIAIGHGGRTMVTGHTYDTVGIRKTLLLVYDSLGATIYSELFHLAGGVGWEEFGADVICEPGGSFYITGQTDTWEGRTDFITIKYTDLVLDLNDSEKPNSAFTVYPNPFSGNFDAEYYSNQNGSGTFALYNNLGGKIAEEKIILEKGKNMFRFSGVDYKPGIYFLSLKLDSGEYLSKKIISLR